MVDTLVDNGEFSLLRLLPQIVRARDFRLYAKDGRRFVDLWQNGGAAVLGHTPPLFLREIKNTASRGLYAPFPHFTEQRFIKALSRLLPGRDFRIYAAPPDELMAKSGDREMFKRGPCAWFAPARPGTAAICKGKNRTAVLWRPFLDFCLPRGQKYLPVPPGNAPLVIPALPGIQGWRGGLPLGLCVCAFLPDAEELPPGDFLPPVLLAAATRGIWDLIAAAPERANRQWPRVNKALKNSPWQRRGIYLFPGKTAREKPVAISAAETAISTAPAISAAADPAVWAALFRRFLDAGFLFPPVPYHPLILPGILSPGEEAKLAEILQFPQGL